MNIKETLKKLIDAKDYPKFIAYLQELYAMQYKAYTWDFTLFGLDFIEEVAPYALASKDMRFILAFHQLGAKFSPEDTESVLKYAKSDTAKSDNIKPVPDLKILFIAQRKNPPK